MTINNRNVVDRHQIEGAILYRSEQLHFLTDLNRLVVHLVPDVLPMLGPFQHLDNIAINPNLIIRTDSEDDLKEKIEQVFDNNTIDGIFALDENDSVAALRIGLKKGYKVPEELSIIGFADGILASRRLSPSLSTLSQYGVEIGEVAANVLINRLDSKEENLPYETTVIKTQLRERESTRRL